MDSIGVRGTVLDWVREWLTGRTQQVVLNGKVSGVGEVRSGVVQGSTLGPTLFLIDINDIQTAVQGGESALDLTSSILSLFADDTKWGRCVDTAEGILSIALAGFNGTTPHFPKAEGSSLEH